MIYEIITLWIALGASAYLFSLFDLWKYFTQEDEPIRIPNTNANVENDKENSLENLQSEGNGNTKSSRSNSVSVVTNSKYWYSATDAEKIRESTTNQKVRIRIDAFLRSEIGDVNSSPVYQLYKHPKYETVFYKFHTQLKSNLVILESLGERNSDSTTEQWDYALNELHEWVKAITEYIMDNLPNFPSSCKIDHKYGYSTTSTMTTIPSYEDILSTSILNRIILTSQENQRATNSPDSAVQTGSELYENTEDSSDSIQNDKVERWVTTTTSKTILSSDDDDLSERTNSTPDENAKRPSNRIVIEEHIEEIIINSYENEEDGNISEPEEPDPDYGDIDDNQVNNIDDDGSWEDNWLFKKKKQAQLKNSANQKQPVAMFIPNPNEIDVNLPAGEDEGENDELIENEEMEIEVQESSSNSEDEIDDPKIEAKLISPLIHTSHVITVEIHKGPDSIETSITQERAEAEALQNSLESNQETLRETSQSLIASNDTLEVEKVIKTKAPAAQADAISTFTPASESTDNTWTPTVKAAIAKFEDENPESVGEKEATAAPPLPMRIAEREKQKWNNPVKIANNPYTPENLVKRISNNSYINSYENKSPESITVQEFDVVTSAQPNSNKIKRDYYINSEDTSLVFGQNSSDSSRKESISSSSDEKRDKVEQLIPISNSSRSSSSSDLSEIKLPSVRNLALRFSNAPPLEDKHKPIPKPRDPIKRVLEIKPISKETTSVVEDKNDPASIPFEFLEIPAISLQNAHQNETFPLEILIEHQAVAKPETEISIPITSDIEPKISAQIPVQEESISVNGNDSAGCRSQSPETELQDKPSRARAMIERLEKLNRKRDDCSQLQGKYLRQKSNPESEDDSTTAIKSPMTAMEFFANQDIKKVTPMEPEEDKIKLRRSVLRESRASKGTSLDFSNS